MSHSRRCLDSNRFGDGFDCICDQEPLPKALARVAELERLAAAWEREALGTQEVLEEATALIERFDGWAFGRIAIPHALCVDMRLFLGPGRCSVCKSGVTCAVHPEAVYVVPDDEVTP